MTVSVKFIAPEPEAQYQALLRSLRRRKGFGINFIQCSPAEATRLISRLQTDLPQKKMDVLALDQPIDNLLEIVARRPDRHELNILFIQGIEKSLEAYIKPGYGGQGDYYKLDTVPRILNHLNQQRENFRDHFSNICFVFIVPLFALKYFMHRAPDFFDWRSGVYKFPMNEEVLEAQLRTLLAFPKEDYKNLTPQECHEKILEIADLLEEAQTDSRKANLLFLQGLLLGANHQYEEAIARHHQALDLNPNYPEAWLNCGIMLSALNRYEEAIASYDRALAIKSGYAEAWLHRGHALREIGRYQEAATDYTTALTLKPNYGDALLAQFSLEHQHYSATESPNVAQQLFNELRRSTQAAASICQAIADRLAQEITQLCAVDQRFQATGIEVSACLTALAEHRLRDCLHYYHLGSRNGRVELHSDLGALVYRYIVPAKNQSNTQAGLSLIEDFLQAFYREALTAFRQEYNLPSTYQPQSLLELAEYMAFTGRYARRSLPHAQYSDQPLIVVRAQTYANL